MPRKRKSQKAFTFWLDPETDKQVLSVFDHFVAELETMKKNAGLSMYQLRFQVLQMMANALAKSKKPELLMPQEKADVLLERLIIAMHEMSDELAEVNRKIAQGIPVIASDLNATNRIKEIVGDYGAFEESAAHQLVSYDIEYEDE